MDYRFCMVEESTPQETVREKSILEQTNEAIKKLEEQNDRMEKNITELANEKLSGTTGGAVEAVPVKEDTPEEYAQKVMGGQIGTEKEE